MIQTEMQRIYKSGIDSLPKDTGSLGSILKNAAPYVIAATLFRGLEQQAHLIPQESVLQYASTALTGSSYLMGALSVFAFFKTVDPYLTILGFKKIEKVTITRQDFEYIKAQVDSLSQENQILKSTMSNRFT